MATYYEAAWMWLSARLHLTTKIEETWYEKLMQQLGEDNRYYHNYDHVKDLLITSQKIGIRDINEPDDDDLSLILAIWFHDVIYNTARNDNEEKSLEQFLEFAKEANLNENIVSLTSDMILATKTHESNSELVDLFLDLDLSILGREREIFLAYDIAIAKEYSWVPPEQYSLARKNIMLEFLNRPTIFKSHLFQQKFEEQARKNIQEFYGG